jgi:hypothetical protein
MSRGEAYEHIRLLDAGGKPVEHVFLKLDEELWDPHGQRFTLFFDPGRIKRGLKPREEAGPTLEEGKRYTLEIDRKWPDAQGNPLRQSYRKSFRAVAPDDVQPDPKTWKVVAPPAGSRAPLTILFPESLDHALLERLLWVVDEHGQDVAGMASAADSETRWQFTPQQPWPAGVYRLVADTALEDLAGNSIAHPFEVDVFKPIRRTVQVERVQVPFQIKAKGK